MALPYYLLAWVLLFAFLRVFIIVGTLRLPTEMYALVVCDRIDCGFSTVPTNLESCLTFSFSIQRLSARFRHFT